MAGYKETPRQKMIGMMYLVLTALLALNVSKQILDAFIVVNETMETTNANFAQKLEGSYSKFRQQYNINPEKVGPYWEKAQQANRLSNEMIAYVDSLKNGVVAKTEGIETIAEAGNLKLADVARIDNFDVPTEYFIGQSHDGSTGRAKDLRDRIDQFRVEMLNLVDSQYRDVIQIGLKTDGDYYDASGTKQNWQMHNFYHTILAATVTILNEIKAEILNAEFDIINNLYSSVTAEDWKFDEIQAKVIPKSNYLFLGEEYEAEILVAAYDTKQNPNVRYLIGSDTLTPGNYMNATPLEGSKGFVTIKIPGSSEGLKKYAGIIKIVSPLGDTMSFHFKDDFIVARPALTISPMKMNVFYTGVENPVDISVPGGPERIIPSITAGKIRQDGKSWIVYDLPAGRKGGVEIQVNAVFAGKTKNMGTMPFRIKPLPEPLASIGGVPDGNISKGLIKVSPYVLAQMPEWFEFDVRYTVTSFTLYIQASGDWFPHQITGNRIPESVLNQIIALKNNSKILVSDINVQGPDKRQIKSIVLTLQP